MSNIIDRILSEVCLDNRIPNGTFDMGNSLHMQVLFETLTDNFGMALNDAKSVHNKMVEGKYPERQAYNRDGLLVTFPTPQHKAKAISRGTHFEKDPSKGPSNVFGGGQQAPAGQPPQGGQPPAAPATPEQPTQNVFGGESPSSPEAPKEPAAQPPAGAGGQSTPSALPKSDTPPAAPSAPSAPASGGGPSSLPASAAPVPTAPGQPPLDVEPQAPEGSGQPSAPAPPPNFDTPKSPEQRAAESQVVKQIFADDPNNPSLNPTMPVNVTEQLRNVLNFAKQMGYNSAMKVISEAMNKK